MFETLGTRTYWTLPSQERERERERERLKKRCMFRNKYIMAKQKVEIL